MSKRLLMTILGMAIVIAQLWREVRPLRAQLHQLRDETGRLSIDDPTKTHVIQVRQADDYTWKWRVWIPDGRAYQVKMATQNIPATGFPTNTGTIKADQPGEMWIEYRIHPNSDGNWVDKLSTKFARVGGSPQPWVNWSRKKSMSEGASYHGHVAEPGEKILLSRFRVSQKATNSTKIEDPSAGFMIWLEPTK